MQADGPPFFRATASSAGVDTLGTEHCLLGDQGAHDRAPEDRLGSWSEWAWDGARLRIRNDRLGFVPLFYAAWDRTIAVSPSLVSLVRQGAPTEVDEPALAAFLRLGFFLGEDTPFTAIRALPPGAVLEWQADGMTLRSRGPVVMPRSELSRSQAIDAYIDLFRAAIRRRLVGDRESVVPLSAGRDSRYILLELCRAGSRPSECVTLLHPPPRRNHDVRVARMLADALGLDHVVLKQNRSRLKGEMEKNLLTHFCADEHTWHLPLVDHLAEGRPLVYDGLAGDTLARPHNFPAAKVETFLAGSVRDQARMLSGPDAYRDRMLVPEQKAKLADPVATGRIERELRRHQDAPNPVGSFYLWNRTRREISLSVFSLLGSVTDVSTPYLDIGVFRHLSSLPHHYLKDDRFRTDVLLRAHPEYAHIPFEGEGRRAPAGLSAKREAIAKRNEAVRHYAPFAAHLIRYAGRGGRSRFIDRRYLVPKLILDLARWSGAEMERYGTMALYLLQLERIGMPALRKAVPVH